MTTLLETAKRLVDHADFQLGGILSTDSKARDIPSRAVSQVKARHLAALREAVDSVEAQTVEPVAWDVYDKHGDLVYLSPTRDISATLTLNCDLRFPENAPHEQRPLFKHPAPPPSAEPICPSCQGPGLLYECVWCSHSNYPPEHQAVCTDFDAPSAERKALVDGLRNEQARMIGTHVGLLCGRAADMLAADACVSKTKESDAQAGLSVTDAQQVAVPQGWQLVPLTSTTVMLTAFFGEDYPQNGYSEMLKAAPQPAAYVPLSDDAIQDFGFNMLPNVTCAAFTEFARAIEQAVRGKT